MKRFIQWLRRLFRAVFFFLPASESPEETIRDQAKLQFESRSAPMSYSVDPVDPINSVDPAEAVDPDFPALPEPAEDETMSTPPSTPPADPQDFSPETPLDDPVDFQEAADEVEAEPEIEAQPVTPSELTGMLEALLFVCDAPASPNQFAQALDRPETEILAGLADLQELYKQTGRGLRLQERNGRYSLVTAPQAAGVIEAFLNLDLSSHLSAPALEALAIVAYRQPVTKAQVEAVRGVDCGGVLRTLLQRGLIEEVGRLDTVGRPILYGVTDFFMQHFGLENMQELPPLPSTDADTLWAATELAGE